MRRGRAVAVQPLVVESVAEWQELDKRNRFVTRGELLFFLENAYDIERARRRERRWHRRALARLRAVLGAFARGESLTSREATS